jgi:hypothetical protein
VTTPASNKAGEFIVDANGGTGSAGVGVQEMQEEQRMKWAQKQRDWKDRGEKTTDETNKQFNWSKRGPGGQHEDGQMGGVEGWSAASPESRTIKLQQQQQTQQVGMQQVDMPGSSTGGNRFPARKLHSPRKWSAPARR